MLADEFSISLDGREYTTRYYIDNVRYKRFGRFLIKCTSFSNLFSRSVFSYKGQVEVGESNGSINYPVFSSAFLEARHESRQSSNSLH